jgi:hypothetical protein
MKKAVCVFRAFDFKDDLKSHGYSWHADSKSWAKEVEESEAEKENDEDWEIEAKGINTEEGWAYIQYPNNHIDFNIYEEEVK